LRAGNDYPLPVKAQHEGTDVGKVILKGYIMVPPSELAAVRAELPAHSRLTLEEPGCLVFEVTQHATDPCRFDVYEEFMDRASFESHQLRVRSSRWGEVTANVARHYEVTG
jgi:autoinducer 2-degrading protein